MSKMEKLGKAYKKFDRFLDKGLITSLKEKFSKAKGTTTTKGLEGVKQALESSTKKSLPKSGLGKSTALLSSKLPKAAKKLKSMKFEICDCYFFFYFFLFAYMHRIHL